MEDEKTEDTGARGKVLPFRRPSKEPQTTEEREDQSVVGAYACNCGCTSFTIYSDGLVQCDQCFTYASNLIGISKEQIQNYMEADDE